MGHRPGVPGTGTMTVPRWPSPAVTVTRRRDLETAPRSPAGDPMIIGSDQSATGTPRPGRRAAVSHGPTRRVAGLSTAARPSLAAWAQWVPSQWNLRQAGLPGSEPTRVTARATEQPTGNLNAMMSLGVPAARPCRSTEPGSEPGDSPSRTVTDSCPPARARRASGGLI